MVWRRRQHCFRGWPASACGFASGVARCDGVDRGFSGSFMYRARVVGSRPRRRRGELRRGGLRRFRRGRHGTLRSVVRGLGRRWEFICTVNLMRARGPRHRWCVVRGDGGGGGGAPGMALWCEGGSSARAHLLSFASPSVICCCITPLPQSVFLFRNAHQWWLRLWPGQSRGKRLGTFERWTWVYSGAM